jgi:hypothetical protein
VRATLKPLIVPIVLCLGISSAAAADINIGAAMRVKPNAIWFQDAAKLTRWQQLKRSGDAKALASYQDRVLGEREAWQFTNELNVKVLSYEGAKRQVGVEMTTEGRLVGTKWVLDSDALVQ